MQTFITSTNPDPIRAAQESAMMLDRARLGKQRVEVKQLLQGDYPNHPASKMWGANLEEGGYQQALLAYGIIICKIWIRRGHQDSLLKEFQTARQQRTANGEPLVWPWWYGHPAMVRTHQTKLYHKGSVRWVNQMEESAPRHLVMKLPYLWPDPDEEDVFRISMAEQKRVADWEIPTAWSYDPATRIVVPR